MIEQAFVELSRLVMPLMEQRAALAAVMPSFASAIVPLAVGAGVLSVLYPILALTTSSRATALPLSLALAGGATSVLTLVTALDVSVKVSAAGIAYEEALSDAATEFRRSCWIIDALERDAVGRLPPEGVEIIAAACAGGDERHHGRNRGTYGACHRARTTIRFSEGKRPWRDVLIA